MALQLASYRTAHLWLPGLFRAWLRRRARPRVVWIAICDHFEPLWRGADEATALTRVRSWREAWPVIAARHADSLGHPPQYTFFYPEEEYRPRLLEPLAELTGNGIADVEVHIHHDQDTEAAFCDRITRYLDALSVRHGLLRHRDGQLAFGFIHGNWALDNARPDGRWCGLNNEITLLRQLGCYADFTLPAAPDPSQAGPVNVIYDVTDDPERPRSHARGVQVKPGSPHRDLTLITGPLGIGFSHGYASLRLETGELAHYRPPSVDRILRWLAVAPRIGENVFVKLFTHGAQEANSTCLLGGGLDGLFSDVKQVCSFRGLRFRFVTAWEMWSVVESLRRQQGTTRVQHGNDV